MTPLHTFGLIGFPLGHSFSKKYYTDKMEKEGIVNIAYELFPIERVESLLNLIKENPNLSGVNVTIPHKVSIMDLLDQVDKEALAIGAVNCVQIKRAKEGNVFLHGFNTDVYGFRESLRPLLKPHHRKALVLGNGGAAKAVIFALQQLGIEVTVVARKPQEGQILFEEVDETWLTSHNLLIQCTPLGTFPDVDTCPAIPYSLLNDQHLLYDLVYNPGVTAFMQKGLDQGASVKNGLEMLELQAERNWELWTEIFPSVSE